MKKTAPLIVSLFACMAFALVAATGCKAHDLTGSYQGTWDATGLVIDSYETVTGHAVDYDTTHRVLIPMGVVISESNTPSTGLRYGIGTDAYDIAPFLDDNIQAMAEQELEEAGTPVTADSLAAEETSLRQRIQAQFDAAMEYYCQVGTCEECEGGLVEFMPDANTFPVVGYAQDVDGTKYGALRFALADGDLVLYRHYEVMP